MDRLGLRLGSEPHVVGRLRSGTRVGAGLPPGGIFGRGLSPGGGLSPRINEIPLERNPNSDPNPSDPNPSH